MSKDALYDLIFEFYLDPVVFQRRAYAREVVFGKSILDRVQQSLVSLFGNLYKSLTIRPAFKQGLIGKKWVVVGSANQGTTLDFLRDQDFFFVGANFYRGADYYQSVNWYHWPKLFYLTRYLPFFWRKRREDPEHFQYVFQALAHGVGMYENHLKTLAAYRPSVIVVSNDHNPWFRALALAARELGIPTVYLPHTSISEDFPSVIVDLALLDGQDGLEKYNRHGDRNLGKMEVIGMPRYAKFAHLTNDRKGVSNIAIAYSLADDLETVGQVVTELCTTFPGKRITLRKHPRDERVISLPDFPNLALSNARTEKALDFLLQQDAVIAGETGIHLEAAMLNVVPVYYPFTGGDSGPIDVYGFIAKGLIHPVQQLSGLVSYVRTIAEHRPEIRPKAAFYCASVGEDFKGNSEELAIAKINELVT